MMGDGVVMERARIGEVGSTGGAEGAVVVVKRATLDPLAPLPKSALTMPEACGGVSSRKLGVATKSNPPNTKTGGYFGTKHRH